MARARERDVATNCLAVSRLPTYPGNAAGGGVSPSCSMQLVSAADKSSGV